MMIFNKRPDEVMVADIGADLKLLNVKLTPQARITAFETVEFSGQNNSETILKPLRNFIQKNNIRHKNCILLPRLNFILVKCIQLPAIPRSELLGAIKWQLKADVPFDLSGAVMDFSVLKESQKGDNAKVLDCLCVIAGEDEIRPQVALLKQLGLHCLAVIPGAFGYAQLIRHFFLQKEAESTAVLHMEEEHSFISIHKGGSLQFYREFPMSVNKLRESLKDVLVSERGKVVLSNDEALEVLFKVGVPEEGAFYKDKLSHQQILSMLRPSLEQLAQEISRSLGYYASQFHEGQVDNVLIAGKLALVPNIEKFLSKELSLNFKKIDLKDEITTSPDINAQALTQGYAAFGSALGYKRNFNLLPYEFAREGIEALQKASLRWAAFLILLFFILSYIFARAGIAGYQKRLDNALLHLNVLSEVEGIKARIDQTNNFVREIRAEQPSAAIILKKLSNIVPKEVAFRALSLDCSLRTGAISGIIKGGGVNPEIILKKFTEAMQGSGYFTDAAISSFEKAGLDESAFAIARFNITFKLR